MLVLREIPSPQDGEVLVEWCEGISHAALREHPLTVLRVRAHLREGNQVLNMYSKKSRTVNLWIARSHQLAGQIVGMQLSIANVLALVVSAASVVAGATL